MGRTDGNLSVSSQISSQNCRGGWVVGMGVHTDTNTQTYTLTQAFTPVREMFPPVNFLTITGWRSSPLFCGRQTSPWDGRPTIRESRRDSWATVQTSAVTWSRSSKLVKKIEEKNDSSLPSLPRPHRHNNIKTCLMLTSSNLTNLFTVRLLCA